MMTQISGALLGFICLGFASLGIFLLVPQRELAIRERIGLHTIYWSFAICMIWAIGAIPTITGWERNLSLGIPVLMGLLLSFMSEFSYHQPTFNINDDRLKKIALQTWKRLPNHVKKGLQDTIMTIQETPQWSELDKAEFDGFSSALVKWMLILPLPTRGIIRISSMDCKELTDDVIAGSLAHEFGLAYQSTRTPFDLDSINRAGEELPVKWNFKKEITALRRLTAQPKPYL